MRAFICAAENKFFYTLVYNPENGNSQYLLRRNGTYYFFVKFGKMRILFVCQYFFPEVFRGNEIAFHWAEAGHDVHVVCGIPNYPRGKHFKGYGFFKNRFEIIKGVRVTRVLSLPRGNNRLMLALNYLSYSISAWMYVLFHALSHKYDMVFVQQLSPVMMSAPGVLYKRLRQVPLYTWVLDLWPESLTAVGRINNKMILSYINLFVKSEYRHSKKLLISSRSFERSIERYGDYHNKIVYYPQWSDIDDHEVICPIKPPVIPEGFKLMFAGTVGEAQDFECIMQAALLAKKHSDIKWIIVGDGQKLEWVKQFVVEHNLEDSVYPLGYFPVETMPWFFAQADAMLVALRNDPLFNLYVPAKISSYMAAGKPIVSILNGEGADVIREADCGWTLTASDADGLARLVTELARKDKEELAEKGANGEAYYKSHFQKEKCLRELDAILGL